MYLRPSQDVSVHPVNPSRRRQRLFALTQTVGSRLKDTGGTIPSEETGKLLAQTSAKRKSRWTMYFSFHLSRRALNSRGWMAHAGESSALREKGNFYPLLCSFAQVQPSQPDIKSYKKNKVTTFLKLLSAHHLSFPSGHISKTPSLSRFRLGGFDDDRLIY